MLPQGEISPNEPDIVPDCVDVSGRGVSTATAEPDPSPPPVSGARHREGECIPNVPDASPDVVSDERVAPGPAPADGPPPPAVPVPRASWFRWHTLGTVLIVAAFGILVIGQAISSLALAATLPVWAQYMLLVPLGFCCLAVLGVCVSLVRSWLRLRVMTQIDIEALEELRRRARTRRDGLEHFQAAKAALRDYLASYPLDGADVRRLQSAGLDTARMAALAKERGILLAAVGDSRSWLEDFRLHFQGGLDAAASSRIKSWSLKAAGCVMASPLPFLDAILVLGIALKMIRDLCVIYNVRSSRAGSFILLNRAVLAAFIAGVAEDAFDVAGGMASEELSGMFGESALAGFGGGLARVVAPKLGEGAINAFFIHRLGRAAVRMLQPLKP